MMSSIALQFASFFLTLKFTLSTSIVFGIHTPPDFSMDSDASDSIVSMTLFFDYEIYQCNVYPINESTFYECDTSDSTTALKCDKSLSSYPIKYGLKIDNDDWDKVVIDKVIIHTDKLSKVLEIIRFCFNNQNCTNTLRLDAGDHYLIPFNISKTLLSATSNIYKQNRSTRCIPDGFICENNNCTFESKYKLIPIKKTWWHANEYCADVLNSSLATITSKQDLQIAVAIRDNSAMYNNNFWIGYTDSSYVSSENKWTWVDKSLCDMNNNNSCDQVFWGPGEPNNENNDGNDGEDCVEIKHQYTFGLFNDIYCTEQRMFFCNDPKYINNFMITTMDRYDIDKSIDTEINYNKYIMLTVIIIALLLIIVTCICLFFYYKKYIRQQIKKETISNQTNMYYDGQPGQRQTYTQYPMVNDINITPKSIDGYNMVKKNSVEHDNDNDTTDENTDGNDDEKEIVIVHNNYNNNNNNIEGNDEGCIIETKMENMIKQYSSSKSNNNNSDDMYDNDLIVEEKNTPTVKDEHIIGYDVIENEQKENINEKQSSDDDIYNDPNDEDDIIHDNDYITAQNIDRNTIGDDDYEADDD